MQKSPPLPFISCFLEGRRLWAGCLHHDSFTIEFCISSNSFPERLSDPMYEIQWELQSGLDSFSLLEMNKVSVRNFLKLPTCHDEKMLSWLLAILQNQRVSLDFLSYSLSPLCFHWKYGRVLFSLSFPLYATKNQPNLQTGRQNFGKVKHRWQNNRTWEREPAIQ